MRHTHAWAGASPRGFFDLSHDSVVRNTTVLLDELLEPLLLGLGLGSTATVTGTCTCAPLLEADGSPADEHTAPFIDEAHGHGLVRNPLEVRLSIPARALAAAPLEAEGLRRRWAVGSAVVFGPETLRRHPAFAPGTPCGGQVPLDAPFYSIADAQVLAEGDEGEDSNGYVHFVAALAPAALSSAVNFMNLRLEWNPDTDAELESRSSSGRSLGDPSALASYQVHRARRLATATKDLVSPMSINWNNDISNPAAANPSIEFLPGGLLRCKDCWAYYAARLVLNVQVCIKTTAVAGRWNAGTSADLAGASAAWAGQYYGGLTGKTQLPDCAALNLPDPLLTGDVAMRVEAYVEGGAGFNFLLTSTPIDVTVSSCASSSTPITAANLASCTKELLPWSDLGQIDLTPLVGIPITINPSIRLRGAAQVSAKYDGELQIGRGYSAAVKLGGKVELLGTAATPTITGINTMTLTAKVVPTVIKAPTVFSATAEAWVYPDIKLAVWNALPFAVYPRLHVTAAFAVGLGPRSLALRGEGDHHRDDSRALQTSTSTNTCPAAVGAAVGGFVEVGLDADMATGTIVTTIGSMQPVKDTMGTALASLLTIQILPDATSPFATILPPTKIMSMCLTSGATSTATTDGAQPTGGTSSGSGGTTGGSTSGSTTGGSTTGGSTTGGSTTGGSTSGGSTSGGSTTGGSTSGGTTSGGTAAVPGVSPSPTGSPAPPSRTPAPTVAASRVMTRLSDSLKTSVLGACTAACLAGGYTTTAFGNGAVRLAPQLASVAATAAGTPTASGCVCLQMMGTLQGAAIVGSGSAARTGTSTARRLQSGGEQPILFMLSSAAGAAVTLSVSLTDGSSAGAVQMSSATCVSGASTFCGDAVPTTYTSESGVSSGANVPAAAAASSGGAIAAAVILTLLLTLAAVGGTLFVLRRRGTIVLARAKQGSAKAVVSASPLASVSVKTSFDNPMGKDKDKEKDKEKEKEKEKDKESVPAAAPSAGGGAANHGATANPATGNAAAAGSSGAPDTRKSFAAAKPRAGGRGSTNSIGGGGGAPDESP